MFIYLNNVINIGMLTRFNAVIAYLFGDKRVLWLCNSPLRVSSALRKGLDVLNNESASGYLFLPHQDTDM